ncbi:hypothetical protein ACT3R7_00210 [Halomonas sp. AOP43-A1-21]
MTAAVGVPVERGQLAELARLRGTVGGEGAVVPLLASAAVEASSAFELGVWLFELTLI